jgi:polyisoprenyl-teichoic acid--peptidoglycan teichoic acid transferase
MIRNLAFRLLTILLVLLIGWSTAQLLIGFSSRYQEFSGVDGRRADYAATAAHLDPDQSSGQSAYQDQIVAQFATNTPLPDSAVLATHTPEAQATPMPENQGADVPSTPVTLPTFFPPAEASIAEIAGTAVPPKAAVVPRDYELINILLLGGDDEITQDNTIRTDTMIIVSINTQVGSVSMLSLPRDLFVYVPTPTMARLNTVYGIGESFGWTGGGFGLLRETIFYNFGIQVHYYALVNISGLETIIDTLGGVDVAVDCSYEDYALVGVDTPSAAYLSDAELGLWTLPVGYYRMTGGEALWFARTRSQGRTDDFDRGRRQQQLLRAIFRKALDTGQLTQLPQLWTELTTTVVRTDVPFDVVLGLLPIALNLDTGRIRSFTMVRTYHTNPWQPPSGAFEGQSVQLLNAEAIFELFSDFYQPPTESQLEMAGPSIAVYNGTANVDWDRVAAERLRTAGLNAYAAGLFDRQDFVDTVLTDYVAQDKGSPVRMIIDELNIRPEQITIEPDPARSVDYVVILGSNYNSCAGSVLQE